jgi:hypothetical protein
LGHRRLGKQERAGDLRGGQAAEGAKGERDLRIEVKYGVAAGEDQLEPLIGKGGVVHRVFGHGGLLEQARLLGERAVAANPVDRAAARCRDQPGRGVRGRAFARPALGGNREGLLRGFLGEVEVAEEADQRSEDAPPFVVKDALEDG